MDYKDYLAGNSKSTFWFRAKVGLIEVLLQKYVKPSSNKLKIFRFGAGTGEELYSLSKFGDVYVTIIEKKALDLIPKGLYKEKKICEENLEYICNQTIQHFWNVKTRTCDEIPTVTATRRT